MTELPEGVRAHECPNQHPVPAGGKFCPTCGEGVATAAAAPFPQAAQISATTPAFSAQFPTGPPWLLGRARFGVLALSAAALVLLTASALLSYFIGGPRLLFYVEVVAGLVLLVHRSKRLGPKEVFGLTMAAAANLVLVQALIFPALARGRGYSDRVNWGEPWGIVALFGLVYLAVGLAALWSPRLRAEISAFLRPRPPTFDVLRGSVVIVLALMALVAVPRAFTGWSSFRLPQSYQESARDQRLTDCQVGVSTRFPEYTDAEKQAAIDFCVGNG